MALARGSSIVATVGGITSLTSQAWAPIKRVFFTTKDVEDPKALYNVLYKLQENLHSTLKPVLQNASVACNRHTGVAIGAGATVYIQHRLGRAFQGYYCVRARGGYPLFQEAAFPAGVDATTVLPLTSSNAGTYDFIIF